MPKLVVGVETYVQNTLLSIHAHCKLQHMEGMDNTLIARRRMLMPESVARDSREFWSDGTGTLG